MKGEELQEVIRILTVINENCKETSLNLANTQFHSSDEEMYLTYGIGGEKFLFKKNDETPRDPVVTHAQRQLCNLIGVPFNFFFENRPKERNEMVKRWLSAVAPEGEEYLIKVKTREVGQIKAIRALLPESYMTLASIEIVDLLTKGSVNTEVDWSSGLERDAIITHIRIIYEDDLDGYRPAISLTTSEVGGSDLILEAHLYHVDSKTYLTAQYGNQPFAKMQYGRVQPSEIREMLNGVPKRILEEAPRYLKALRENEEAFRGVDRACAIISAMKGVPKKFGRSIRLEAMSCEDDMTTMPDFLRHVGLVAKDFDLKARSKIEIAAGSFAGLRFEKN